RPRVRPASRAAMHASDGDGAEFRARIEETVMWPDNRICELFGIELPIVQAPMAGSSGSELAIAVSEAGGLGALPCALLSAEQIRSELGIIRQRTSRPVNLNFFCHEQPKPDAAREAAWRERLAPYYAELGLEPD